MADEPVRSVLYDVQERQGGTFDDFGGWMWTLDFGDVAAEYEALRSGAGMWDVYALNKWTVSGPDAPVGPAGGVHEQPRHAAGRSGSVRRLRRRRRSLAGRGHHLQARPTAPTTRSPTRTPSTSTCASWHQMRTYSSRTDCTTCHSCRSRDRVHARSCSRSATSTSARCPTSGSRPSRCPSRGSRCSCRALASQASSDTS